jgi:hypothetical protein
VVASSLGSVSCYSRGLNHRSPPARPSVSLQPCLGSHGLSTSCSGLHLATIRHESGVAMGSGPFIHRFGIKTHILAWGCKDRVWDQGSPWHPIKLSMECESFQGQCWGYSYTHLRKLRVWTRVTHLGHTYASLDRIAVPNQLFRMAVVLITIVPQMWENSLPDKPIWQLLCRFDS